MQNSSRTCALHDCIDSIVEVTLTLTASHPSVTFRQFFVKLRVIRRIDTPPLEQRADFLARSITSLKVAAVGETDLEFSSHVADQSRVDRSPVG